MYMKKDKTNSMKLFLLSEKKSFFSSCTNTSLPKVSGLPTVYGGIPWYLSGSHSPPELGTVLNPREANTRRSRNIISLSYIFPNTVFCLLSEKKKLPQPENPCAFF